jgi:pimeloyl-ACP methyl ester carboxylesterase
MLDGIVFKFIDGAGVRLHAAFAGDSRCPLVILLHGFPEFWYSWRHQIPALAEAGFFVIAPDLRGYNLSDKPSGIDSYHIRLLVEDVACIVRAHAGSSRASIVGHDWGGILAWTFAGQFPHLTDKLVIMNAPHMGVYRRCASRPPQLLRSWYVAFFCLPWLPELILSSNNFFAIAKMFKTRPAVKGAFSEEEIGNFVQAIAVPGALRSALNYYRCGMLNYGGMKLAIEATFDSDALILWGEKDPALDASLLYGIETYAPRTQIKRFPGSSHWIQSELPDDVNQALIQFLKD